MDTWLSTDTGEDTETLLQAAATAAAASINKLLEKDREGGHHGQTGSAAADTKH